MSFPVQVRAGSRSPEEYEAVWVTERARSDRPALQVLAPEGFFLVSLEDLQQGQGAVYRHTYRGMVPTSWSLTKDSIEGALLELEHPWGRSKRYLNGFEGDEEEEYPETPERVFGPGLGGLLEDAEGRRVKSTCARGSLPEYRLALTKSRCVKGVPSGERLPTPTAIGDFLAKHFGCQPQEQFLALGFNPRNELLGVLDVGTGGLDSTAVDPRVLFAGLVLMGASAFVVCHNHPSGNPEPSSQDVELTRQLRRSAETLSVRLLDHIIIAPGGELYSMLRAGLLQ